MDINFKLNKNLYINNRKRFAKHLKDNSVAIFISNDEVPSNGDAIFPYVQNSDLLWLCGIEQPHTFYVVSKQNKVVDEFLFIKNSNPLKEIWDGKYLNKAQAQEMCGIEKVQFSEGVMQFLQVKINSVETIYLNTNENDRKNGYYESAGYAFIEMIKKQYPLHQYERAAKILKYERAIKNAHEIERIQIAIDITAAAFKKVLKWAQPNCWEYEIKAQLVHHFLMNGSSGFSFSPIIASGDNARILHYISNLEQCKNGDLVLMDFGATFKNYHADITRTIPINGIFTKRQKEIYNACLRLNEYATTLLKPKTILSKYTEAVGKEATKMFLNLGILKPEDVKNEDSQNPAYRKFLYHGISHHLGLDVHDFADKEQALQAGMVLTVEPGIYIAEEKIGLRLENNLLITKSGNINLSKNIPIKADDIEELMKIK